MATYYIKNGGNDALDGLTDATAWLTIAKMNSIVCVPGDIINLKRGSKWEEILEPKGDGTLANYITYRDYGTGEKPIITGAGTLPGSDVVGNWTETSAGSQHWYISVLGMGYSIDNMINRLWIAGVEKRRSETLALLTSTDLFFYDKTPDNLYIHSVANPATIGDIKIGNVRSRALNLYDDNYFAFYNIDFQGGWFSIRITGVSDCAGYLFDSCNIGKDTPGYGLSSGISGKQVDDVIIRNCTFDTGMLIKYVIGNFYIPVRGIDVQFLSDNWDIYENYFKNWGYAAFTYIYVVGYDLTNLKFHDNEITSPDTYEGKPIGISSPNGSTQEYYNNYMHDIGVGCQMTGVGWKFYYNIIDNVRGAPLFTTVSRCGVIISTNVNSSCKDILMVNNTICNCSGPGIYLGYNVANNNHENEFINNILFNNGADEDDEQIEIRYFTNVHQNTFKNNLLYKAGITDLVNYRGTFLTVAEFNAENGNEYNEVIEDNITGDPLFISLSDFRLQGNSPAIDAGLDVGLTLDFIGASVPYGSAPDIGAFEHIYSVLINKPHIHEWYPFPTVTIGTQTWMFKNWDWQTGVYPNADKSNNNVYGGLYTFAQAVVIGTSVLGWHLPTKTEFETLSSYLGGNTVSGGHMKEMGIDHWTVPNTDADNISGFKALGAGNNEGNFGLNARFWTSSEEAPGFPYHAYLRYDSGAFALNYSGVAYTCSVRLIKDV